MKEFVPDEFDVPTTVEFPNFVFKPLDEAATDLDYDAVMSSREDLTRIFGSDDEWPAADLSWEQNRQDLRKHSNLFIKRTSFAWTVLTPDLQRCIGCVYFYWPLLADYDATVYLWVRSDELKNGLDAKLEAVVKLWLTNEWPFKKPAFPGRDIPWEEWQGGCIRTPEGDS